MGNHNNCRGQELCGWWEAGAANSSKSAENVGRSMSLSLLLCLSRKGRKTSARPNPKAPEKHDEALEKQHAAALSPPATPEHRDRPLPDGSAPHPAGSTRTRQVTPEPCPAPHPTSLCRGTMTLAGGTFQSALPLPHTRGQTWQCQKSSALGDRTTWHGTHQETVSPVPCTQTRGRGDANKQHLLLPPTQTHLGPSHQHPLMPRACGPAVPGHKPSSPGGRTAPSGAGGPCMGSEGGRSWRGHTTQGYPAGSVCCSELTPLRKGIYRQAALCCAACCNAVCFNCSTVQKVRKNKGQV